MFCFTRHDCFKCTSLWKVFATFLSKHRCATRNQRGRSDDNSHELDKIFFQHLQIEFASSFQILFGISGFGQPLTLKKDYVKCANAEWIVGHVMTPCNAYLCSLGVLHMLFTVHLLQAPRIQENSSDFYIYALPCQTPGSHYPWAYVYWLITYQKSLDEGVFSLTVYRC